MVLNDRSATSRRESRSPAVAALAAALSLAAGLVAASCSDPTPPVPQVALDSTISPGAHTSAQCGQVSGPWVVIGDNYDLIKDGSSYKFTTDTAAQPISVSCRVVPSNGGFDVTAQANVDGAGNNAGSFTILGSFTATGVQNNVAVTYLKGDKGTFKQSDCTVTYAAGTNQSVKAGAIWGTLDCPNLVDASGKTLGSTGEPATCEGKAEFRFENCNQ